MLKYGSDKPDLRNPILITDVTEHFVGSGFGIFAGMLETPTNVIRAVPAPGAGAGSRKFCDHMNNWARARARPRLHQHQAMASLVAQSRRITAPSRGEADRGAWPLAPMTACSLPRAGSRPRSSPA